LLLTTCSALIHISHFFYSWPAAVTTTSSYNYSAVAYIATYTLCDVANELFNITSDEGLTDDMLSDAEWLEEYDRVCIIRLDAPLPTVGFNKSITLSTSDTVTASYTSLSAGASATATGAAQTSSAPTTTPIGTTEACYSWHIATAGDYCGLIEEEFGITFDNFQEWNPSINSDCSNIIVGDAYCIDGDSTIKVTSVSTSSAPASTVSGTASVCYSWHIIISGDYCSLLEEEYGISFDLFRVWNPSINNECSNLVVGNAYCMDGTGRLSRLSTSSAPAAAISGTVSLCYKWHTITSNDYCELLEDEYGLTFDLLRAWNPSIDNECDNLVVGDAYCIDGAGRASSVTTVLPSASTAVETTSTCYDGYTVVSGDTCSAIEDAYGLYFDLFRAWNPSINNDCSNLQVGEAYCVDGTGTYTAKTTSTSLPASVTGSTTTAPTTTTPTATSTTSSVATPTPHSVSFLLYHLMAPYS
jgi:LysM repeat protein